MTEEDSVFDPILKKEKKKKTTFDIDAACNEGGSGDDGYENIVDKDCIQQKKQPLDLASGAFASDPEALPDSATVVEDDEALDLENVNKKKKEKEEAHNLDGTSIADVPLFDFVDLPHMRADTKADTKMEAPVEQEIKGIVDNDVDKACLDMNCCCGVLENIECCSDVLDNIDCCCCF